MCLGERLFVQKIIGALLRTLRQKDGTLSAKGVHKYDRWLYLSLLYTSLSLNTYQTGQTLLFSDRFVKLLKIDRIQVNIYYMYIYSIFEMSIYKNFHKYRKMLKEFQQICSHPSRHLLAQSQQQKHWNKVGNMFKVNNKDTRTTPVTSSVVLVSLLLTLNIFYTYMLCFYCYL